MSPSKAKSGGQSAQPTPDQTTVTPSQGNMRHVLDQDVAMTMLMQMQNSMGDMNSTLNGMTKAVDGVRGKVDELIAWKNKILGGAIVLGVVTGAIFSLFLFASRYVTLKAIDSQPAPQSISAPVPTPLPQPHMPDQRPR